MISNAFKKQLIVNNYKTQLLPITNEVSSLSIESFNYTKNWVLFKTDDKSLWIKYNYNNIIEYDINWLLHYLIYPTVSIYTYNIKNILETKHHIDNRLDYAKYLEDIYD